MPSPAEIPELLARVVAFARVDPARRVSRTVFHQEGQMWQEPGAKAMAFTAEERMAATEVAFHWRARFPMMPLVHLEVVDAYEGGVGVLQGRLWGRIPLFKTTGPDADVGEAYRYLAELAWVPAAYLSNEQLVWRQRDARWLEVSWELRGQTLTVAMEVDEDGRVLGIRAEDRPREVDGVAVPTPWVGRFDDWAEHDGVMVPTSGEIAWELPDGPFTYWRGRITSFRQE